MCEFDAGPWHPLGMSASLPGHANRCHDWGVSEQTLEITGDLLNALGDVLGSRPERPGAVVVLAAYLDLLARSYGLSTSSEESWAERARPPAAALALVRQYLGDASDPVDEVALGNLLYETFVSLSIDPRACRLLNKSKPLVPAELLMASQLYWNLERDVGARSELPCHSAGEIAIKVRGVPGDFATMAWASRMENGPDGLRGNTGRKKGARLAALAAERLMEYNRQVPTPLADAEFQQEAFGKSTRWRIVWPAEERHDSTTGPIVTSRARAYYAIDGFEQSLRQCIETFLLDHLQAQQVFGTDYDQLGAIRAQADVSETEALTHYLYPQQAYDILLRHASALPVDLVDQLRGSRDEFYDFLTVRNRVMRGRPLRPDDLVRVESFVVRFRRPHFSQSEAAFSRLIADSGLQPSARPGSKPPERILHNLPNPDFDETGLLGREREISEIVELVKRRREPITLIGPGGAGKTALALEVCYGLADEPTPPFEAILWTSLKTETLTAAGVRGLANPIRDIASAANALGQALDTTFVGSVRELAHALGETKTLIVLDNLETVNGSDFLRLYDSLPSTVAFLLTSRVGIGELERRIAVGPLKEDSAEQLFRKFARSRGLLELADRSPVWIGDVLNKLAYSPLGIRWHILRVEAGAAPTDILNDQAEYLKFCVADVVSALSGDERSLLDVLRSIDHPISFGDLANLSDLGVDPLRRSAQRLQQCSLADWSQSGSEDEPELLALSSTARAYLRTLAIPGVADGVLRRETDYNHRRELERERRAEHGRYLDPNVVFLRSPGDEPTALLLQQALRESKAGDSEAAHAAIERARALNPGFFEVDRVEAFIGSSDLSVGS